MELKNQSYRHKDNLYETLGKIPKSIPQRFILILTIIFVVFFILSFIFRYPDTVNAPVTITSTNPPIHLIARQSGRVQDLFVVNNQLIKKNTPVAIIENSANTQDVNSLNDKIDFCLSVGPQKWDSIFHDFHPQLGDINQSYSSFKDALHSYATFISINYYPQKIDVTEKQIVTMTEYRKITNKQLRLKKEELVLKKAEFSRDSLLHIGGLLSVSNYEASKILYIQSQNNSVAMEGTLKNIDSQINTLHETILDLRLQEDEKMNNLNANLMEAFESLKNAIEAWKINYLLMTPIDGKVVFTNIWSSNQNLKSGDIAFTVISDKKNELIGKALLPSMRAGKVKVGQRVKIKLNNYPDMEFGSIPGIIHNISEIPVNDNYTIEIKFPDGLQTTYNKKLPSDLELSGDAIIVTEELRLIERLFLPIKNFVVNATN